MPAILLLTNELLDEAAYQTLPTVMVAFFKDNSTFVSDILLRFQELRPIFIRL